MIRKLGSTDDPNKVRESTFYKPKVGSLLGLFQSEYFTIDMNMIYLNKRLEDGIHAYLVNKLYTWKDHEVDFYFPQLCYLLIRRKSLHLEKYILDKCTKSIPLFLKIFWCLKAYGQSEKKNKKSFEYIEGLIIKAERAMVNGTAFPDEILLDCDENKLMLSINIQNQEEKEIEMHKIVDFWSGKGWNSLRDEVEKKKLRSEYLNETLKFTNILITVSLKLKRHKIEERKKLCRSYMHRLNKLLIKMRKRHAEDRQCNNLFKGIQFPFSDFSGTDYSTTIINIVEDEISCFNTKKRVPYKIVVETVDLNDFDNYEPKLGEKEKSLIHEAMHEVDNWDDIDLEREALKDEALANKVINNDDKYGALVNFNKIAQEEAQKIKDQKLLKDIDLSEKLQQIQRTRSSTVKTTNFALALEKKYGAPEEQKIDFSSPTNYDKSSKSRHYTKKMNLIHKQNIQEFNTFFPICGQLTKRKSFDDQPKSIVNTDRRFSLQYLSLSDIIKQMTIFRYLNSTVMNMDKIDKVINQLSQEAVRVTNYSPNTKKKQSSLSNENSDVMKFGPWDELWEHKKQYIQKNSAFGHFPSYKLRCLIIKGDDDLRQELITMQLIKKIEAIWKEAGLTLRLRTYDIIVTSEDSGILEFVPDTFSIDGLKKKVQMNLRQFYEDVFGYNFEEAQKNFMDSLAAYCLICYFLQIKDRHNGNILIDAHGYLVHIDFGFILSISPGGINFESAPFKLTQEYVELMGGIDSDTYTYFKLQILKGFMELRKHLESIVYMLQIMMDGSDLPCFENFDIYTFRERFREKSTDKECMDFIERLIDNSYDNWRTVQYDNFQKMTNNIMP